jgi:hypothetical protein
MTTKEAIAFAKGDNMDREQWENVRAVLIAAKICPACIQDGLKSPLGQWRAGNYWANAGRECLTCEDFVACGEQPEYGPDDYIWSDADPGL